MSRPPGRTGAGCSRSRARSCARGCRSGLHAGDRLRLHVVGRDGDQLVLRRVAEERPAARACRRASWPSSRESGDGDQLRAALALAGGPIPLPGGRVLTVEPDAGEEPEGRERADEGSVRRRPAHAVARRARAAPRPARRSRSTSNVVADPAGRGGRVRRAARAARGGAVLDGPRPAQVEVAERRGAAAAGAGRRARRARCGAMAEPRKKVAAALSYPGPRRAEGRRRRARATSPSASSSSRARPACRTREDSALAQALAELELGSEIPPLLYQAVAEALVWALRLDRSLRADAALNWPARRPNTRPLSSTATPASRRRRSAPGGTPVPIESANPYTADAAAPLRDDRRPDERREPSRSQRQSRLLGHPRQRHRERLPRQGRARLRLRLRAQRAEPVVALQADGRRRPLVRQPRARAREPAVDRLPAPTATSSSRRTASTSATWRRTSTTS